MAETSANRVIWHRFEEHARRDPDKPALIDAALNTTCTYGELQSTVLELASVLERRLEPIVAFIGDPTVAELPIVLACAKAGKILAPISEKEPADRQGLFIDRLQSDVLVVRAGVRALDPETWRVVTGEKRSLEHGEFLITHSSGTTGLPKPILFTQKTKLARTMQSIHLFDVQAEDRVLNASPLHHSLGQRHFFVALMAGATMIKSYPFQQRAWIDAVRTFRPSFCVPVSTHLKILSQHIKQDPSILDSFRCIVTSSAPAEAEFKRQVLDQADFDFWEIYGASEVACMTAAQYQKGDANTEHLGPALPGVELKIEHGGNPGDIGQLLVRSQFVCDGYFGQDDLWNAALQDDRWFKTGDLGCFDEDGNFYFKGRDQDSFQVGGLTVHPPDIENALLSHKGIDDCVVCGLDNPIFGALVGLAYVPSDPELTPADVIAFARSKLPKHQVPVKLRAYPAFPALGSGKVDLLQIKKDLRGN